MVGWAAVCLSNGWDLRHLLLPSAGLAGLVAVFLREMAALRSELDRTRFQLDTEVESSAILAKELELMLARQRDSPKYRKIGAFWSGSAVLSTSRDDETKEEKEQRVAEYLEEVGGIVVSERDLRTWVTAEDGLKKAQADIDMTRALLSESLRSGRKTEAINEALFVLSKDVI